MMSARVTAIYRKKAKNTPRTAVNTGFLRAGYGLEGDCNSGKKTDKQLCILRREDREAVDADNRDGLCFKRFLETVQIEGLSREDLAPGRKLTIGPVHTEVTGIKRCWPECAIVQAGEQCALARGATFLAILNDGEINLGDEVEW